MTSLPGGTAKAVEPSVSSGVSDLFRTAYESQPKENLGGHLWLQDVKAGISVLRRADELLFTPPLLIQMGTVKSIVSSCTTFSLPFCPVGFTEHHAAENLQG